MTEKELMNHFTNFILPYQRRVIDQPPLKQEYIVEEMFEQVEKEYQGFTSTNPIAKEKWHVIKNSFFSQIIGLIEDKSFDELNQKLHQLSNVIVESILELYEEKTSSNISSDN
ncbi:hypothetical protein [Streptococcus dysgalactiae]|uniref:hypothetical protein n=1 Tax=Streptococcus dysgalactiae TaxID=1334 RepID=UPI0008071833|nr:hypothetical protein [Streptococcus dysgalactiae]